MTVAQLRKVYADKETTPCPITNRLVMAGYQQNRANEGYTNFAYSNGMVVDYRKAEPTQWWHLLKSYCDRSDDKTIFTKSIVCGELYVWMAEVLECVDTEELSSLVDEIIGSAISSPHRDKTKPQVKYDRRRCNSMIQDLCFDRIVEKVESLCE